jgi:hypothetical protein
MSASVLQNYTELFNGYSKGSLVFTATANLIAGTINYTVTPGLFTANTTVFAVPASSAANANAGTLTTTLDVPAPGSPYIGITVTSSNAADVGLYRIFAYD